MELQKIKKKDKLHSDSEVYYVSSEIYEEFSKAEDSLNIISDFLKNKVQNKEVLDFGCGTGKFIKELAPLCKSYIGMDISENQLQIAKEKSKESNIKLVKNANNKIPLESNSIDIIFSAWVIGGIHNLKIRKEIIQEMKRVAKENGSIYLIENNIGGEYKEIVEENYGEEKTKLKLKWLEENNFKKIKSFKTYFEFENLEDAKEIFFKIFGEEVANKIKDKKTSHNIVIYENER